LKEYLGVTGRWSPGTGKTVEPEHRLKDVRERSWIEPLNVGVGKKKTTPLKAKSLPGRRFQVTGDRAGFGAVVSSLQRTADVRPNPPVVEKGGRIDIEPRKHRSQKKHPGSCGQKKNEKPVGLKRRRPVERNLVLGGEAARKTGTGRLWTRTDWKVSRLSQTVCVGQKEKAPGMERGETQEGDVASRSTTIKKRTGESWRRVSSVSRNRKSGGW